MRISQVLGESGRLVTEIDLDFNDLTSLEVGALRAIADERIDYDNASDQMLDIVYNLQIYNLVDSEFELTDMGRKAVELANTLGGSSERRNAARRQAPNTADDLDVDVDDVYDDDYGGDLGYDEDDMSEFNHNRFGSPNQNN